MVKPRTDTCQLFLLLINRLVQRGHTPYALDSRTPFPRCNSSHCVSSGNKGKPLLPKIINERDQFAIGRVHKTRLPDGLHAIEKRPHGHVNRAVNLGKSCLSRLCLLLEHASDHREIVRRGLVKQIPFPSACGMRTYSACVPSMVLPNIQPPWWQWEYMAFLQKSQFKQAVTHERMTLSPT